MITLKLIAMKERPEEATKAPHTPLYKEGMEMTKIGVSNFECVRFKSRQLGDSESGDSTPVLRKAQLLLLRSQPATDAILPAAQNFGRSLGSLATNIELRGYGQH